MKNSTLKFITERTLFLPSNFNDSQVDVLIKNLFDLNKSEGRIFLHINSSGGSFSAAKKLYENILLSRNEVDGIVAGICFSGAALIFQACKKRYATPLSILGVHYITYPIAFTVEADKKIEDYLPFINDEFNRLQKNNETIRKILSKRMVIDEKKIHQLLLKEKELDVHESLKIGIIDEIIIL